MTIDWHYTMGLVSRFPVKNTQALFIMRDDAALLEWSCSRLCVFVTKRKISPNLLNFGLNMFRSFQLRKRVPTLYVSDHKQRSYWSLKLPNHASFSPLLHNVSFHKRTVRALWVHKMLPYTICSF